ncbi:unnamed protein product [Vicia faba]|uniref:FAR1 domain-containing protein n=1 Tax=Vicia faba TaxID=3906 RepID=A0AAV1ATV0_VICFA|nr:unnamed protein product [Vicia faba]
MRSTRREEEQRSREGTMILRAGEERSNRGWRHKESEHIHIQLTAQDHFSSLLKFPSSLQFLFKTRHSKPFLFSFTIFMDLVVVDSDKGNEEESTSIFDGVEVQEPYVGLEFDSEEAARTFYVEYAKRVGFLVRVMQRRRSGIDGRTLARRLGCNKQGFSPNSKGTLRQEKRPRPSAREGCKATILVKMEKSGKWVVTRFVKDHNHPLIATANGFSTEDDKDKKIAELTMELERQDELCTAYREKLLSFINNLEEETEGMSTKIQLIIENIKRAETEMQKSSQNRKPLDCT